MTTYTATLPNGTEVTRSSKNPYRFVVAFQVADGRWGAYQWTGSEKSAASAIRKVEKIIAAPHTDWTKVELVGTRAA